MNDSHERGDNLADLFTSAALQEQRRVETEALRRRRMTTESIRSMSAMLGVLLVFVTTIAVLIDAVDLHTGTLMFLVSLVLFTLSAWEQGVGR